MSKRRGIRSIVRWLNLTINPVTWWRMLRHAMTPASVTLLIVSIISLNIIWGYPWLGMFSVCIALLVVGWIVNRSLAPRMTARVEAPRWVHCGQAISVSVGLTNRGRLPAMDLDVRLEPDSLLDIHERRAESVELAFVPVGAAIRVQRDMVFEQRGVTPLPDVQVDSYFPFHLFRATKRLRSGTEIAVVPALLTVGQDTLFRQLASLLQGVAYHKQLGDQVHYIGNREYREGLPVRKWDFASWARLGKPILREFHSPSTNQVRILIDLRGSGQKRDGSDSGDFERLLSLVASAMVLLSHSGVAMESVWMQPPIAGETLGELVEYRESCSVGGDLAELMIPLASLQVWQPSMKKRRVAEESQRQYREWFQNQLLAVASESLIVFSLHPAEGIEFLGGQSCHWVTPKEIDANVLAKEAVPLP